MTKADYIRWIIPLRLRQLRRAGVAVLAGRRRRSARCTPRSRVLPR